MKDKYFFNFIFYPLLLSSLVLFFVTLYIESSMLGLLLRIRGFIEASPYLLVFFYFFCVRKSRKIYNKELFYLFLFSLLVVFYSALLSYFYGNTLKYTMSDIYRFMMSFSLLAFLSVCIKNNGEIYSYIFNAIKALIYILILQAFFKLIFVLQGTYYGGGVNQFLLSPFLFVIFFSCLVDNNFLSFSRLKISLILFSSILLTVLSFKREYWVILLLSSALCFLVFFLKKRSYIILLLMVFCVSVFIYFNPEIIKLLIYRFESTFNNQTAIGMDKSSFERYAEIFNSFRMIGSDAGFLEFIFGRGAGAEFTSINEFELAKATTGSAIGSYHHIHNMFALLIFRHGILSILLYLTPIVFLIIGLFRIQFFRNSELYSTLSVIYLAATLELCFGLISALASNSFYGSIEYGLFLSIAYFCFRLLRFSSHECINYQCNAC